MLPCCCSVWVLIQDLPLHRMMAAFGPLVVLQRALADVHLIVCSMVSVSYVLGCAVNRRATVSAAPVQMPLS